MGFTTFGLSEQIMKGIRAAGYTVPTPIQKLAIEPALAGNDVIGCAQTGTGKTAAFVLPMLQRLSAADATQGRERHPRALVLTPTRELCQQVQDAVAKYGRFLSIRSVSIYGGVSMENQLKLLRRGTDIVVATPGRLLDHMQRRTVDLSKIQVLVLDEADRMLDMGFINDVRKIIKEIPAKRQTFLFSATLSPEINSLAANILRDPHTVSAGERRNPVETIEQHFYSVPQEAKMDLLFHALDAEKMQSVLIFSRTKHGADKICKRLERANVNAVAIHSNRTQSQRERALDGFKQGKFRVLVATDIAARGIDVNGISHVINYDIPPFAEDYIHRIGRTGRAGATGDAITFVGRDEQQYLRRIEQYVGKKIPLKSYPGFTPSTSAPVVRHTGVHSATPLRGHSSHTPGANSNHRPAGHGHQRPDGKKGVPMTTPRRKKGPPGKMDSYSSDSSASSDSSWSNH